MPIWANKWWIMELWIRSQDKENLVQVDCLCIEINEYDTKNYEIVQGCITLGTYETKERCLEILDEIQNILKPQEYEIQTGRGTFTTSPSISNYVYEMPKVKEYKKALKEKCNAIDKAVEILERDYNIKGEDRDLYEALTGKNVWEENNEYNK